jgi:hypothetical protein
MGVSALILHRRAAAADAHDRHDAVQLAPCRPESPSSSPFLSFLFFLFPFSIPQIWQFAAGIGLGPMRYGHPRGLGRLSQARGAPAMHAAQRQRVAVRVAARMPARARGASSTETQQRD